MMHLHLPEPALPAAPEFAWVPGRRLLRAALAATWPECRLDAAARAAWRDPVQFRREHLPSASRARRVLDEAARRAAWSGAVAPDRVRGVAMAEAGGTWVAAIADRALDGRLLRVVAAVDAGPLIDLDGARQDVLAGLRAGLDAIDASDADHADVRLEVHWVLGDVPGTERHRAAADALAPAVANADAAARAERARRRALQATPG